MASLEYNPLHNPDDYSEYSSGTLLSELLELRHDLAAQRIDERVFALDAMTIFNELVDRGAVTPRYEWRKAKS